MFSRLMRVGCLAVLITGSVFIANAQNTTTTTTTKKEVVVNNDGSYSVIEYPVGKEVTVNLLPGTTVTGSKGNARILRAADGTKVYLDVSGVPSTVSSYYAYAVDPAGVSTLLGPVTFNNGMAKAEFSTPMNQFMVVLSPTEGLTAIDPTTTVVYRSDIPTGYTIVPMRTIETGVTGVNTMPTAVVTTTTPTGVTVSTTNTPGVVAVNTMPAAYEVPLLNIQSFGEKEREVKLKFGGELEGLEAKAWVDREKGSTKVKMKFDDMKKIPAGKRFTLWASSPEGTYTKLGQIYNSGRRDAAEIKSETALTDFGLFLTVEDGEVTVPTSRIYSVFAVPIS
ncbi:MAG: hypothetical protein H0V90_09175 [Blastocatellia bacterium]|nr:hypothetical protein [Blastocatellia bacterium]